MKTSPDKTFELWLAEFAAQGSSLEESKDTAFVAGVGEVQCRPLAAYLAALQASAPLGRSLGWFEFWDRRKIDSAQDRGRLPDRPSIWFADWHLSLILCGVTTDTGEVFFSGAGDGTELVYTESSFLEVLALMLRHPDDIYEWL